MNALNRILTSIFDVALTPLELFGVAASLIVVSGLFGVLALLIFKYISWQKGIKAAKDRIKAHMIEIRLYQDDLVVVGKAVTNVLLRNFQYLALNFGPILPLIIPFAWLAAQFVTRYAYDPVPLVAAEASLMPGQGTMVEIELKPDQKDAIRGLKAELPAGVKAISKLVRAPSEGRAFIEVVPLEDGVHELAFVLADGTRATKLFLAGDASLRTFQPRRVATMDWYRLHEPDRWPTLWPAEPAFDGGSPFRTIAFAYPERDLGWLPGGEVGILITVIVASMVVGAAALKPLGVQI